MGGASEGGEDDYEDDGEEEGTGASRAEDRRVVSAVIGWVWA